MRDRHLVRIVRPLAALRALASRALAVTRAPLVRRVLLVLLALVALRVVWIVGHVLWWRSGDIPVTSFMEDRLDVMKEKDPKARLLHEPVPYGAISSHLKRAVLAAEDARFRHHPGFDVEGLTTAVEKNLRAGRVVMGGSTISQQLAKNLFLTPERSWARKLEEAFITVLLEVLWGKRRILEVYLNVIEWGDGVFGAEAAARRHFGTTAAALSADQAALLAAMIPNPRYYATHKDDARLRNKAGRVRAVMDALAVP